MENVGASVEVARNAALRGPTSTGSRRLERRFRADDGRRRIERDLHDGAHQQLVTLALALAMRSTEDRIPPGRSS